MPSQRAMSLLSLARSGDGGRRLTKEEARKFLLTTSAPSIIQPEEADELIDYVIEECELLDQVTTWRMDTNEQDIRFLDIDGGILRQIVCGQPCTESVDISATSKCLRTVSLDAKFYLCDTDIEDNLIGAELERKVLGMAARQMCNELELYALMANVGLTYTRPSEISNSVLGLRDGWYRQLQFGNLIDANAVNPGDRTITADKLSCMMRALPTKYRRNRSALRIFWPMDMTEDWMRFLQARETPLGDRMICGPAEMCYSMTPIVDLALIPTDIQNCGCGSLPAANGTFMFLTDPKNLIWGVQREIQFERDREACAHRTWFIYSLRVDMLVLNEDATVLVDCMQLDSCGDSVCIPPALAAKCNQCIDLGSGGDARVP